MGIGDTVLGVGMGPVGRASYIRDSIWFMVCVCDMMRCLLPWAYWVAIFVG